MRRGQLEATGDDVAEKIGLWVMVVATRPVGFEAIESKIEAVEIGVLVNQSNALSAVAGHSNGRGTVDANDQWELFHVVSPLPVWLDFHDPVQF